MEVDFIKIEEFTKYVKCQLLGVESCSESIYCFGRRVMCDYFRIHGIVKTNERGRSRKELKKLRKLYPEGKRTKILGIIGKIRQVYTQAAPKIHIDLSGDNFMFECRHKKHIDAGNIPWDKKTDEEICRNPGGYNQIATVQEIYETKNSNID